MLAAEVDRFLVSLVTTRSPQTVTWYKKRLAPLKVITKNISSISLSDLQSVYAQLAQQKARWLNHPSGRAPEKGGLSPATLRGYVRAWRSFFNWLVDDGVLACSPAAKLKLPRLPDQPPKAVTRSDMELIVEAARLSSERDYAILCILADSACRVSGLCSITLDNLDLDRAQPIEQGMDIARYRRLISSMAAGTPPNSTRCMIGIRGSPLTIQRKPSLPLALTPYPLPC